MAKDKKTAEFKPAKQLTNEEIGAFEKKQAARRLAATDAIEKEGRG